MKLPTMDQIDKQCGRKEAEAALIEADLISVKSIKMKEKYQNKSSNLNVVSRPILLNKPSRSIDESN